MKLDLTEVYFLQQASVNVSVKAKDARLVADLLEKLDKEFDRLQKIEEKKNTEELAKA
jgi:acylphosphatase